MAAAIRKLVVQVDETRIEMGRPIEPATRRAVAMAVISAVTVVLVIAPKVVVLLVGAVTGLPF